MSGLIPWPISFTESTHSLLEVSLNSDTVIDPFAVKFKALVSKFLKYRCAPRISRW